MKQKATNTIVQRKNYKELEWKCNKVFLNFEIYSNFIILYSKLYFFKKSKNISKPSFLLLNGKNLYTISSKINYKNKSYFLDLNKFKLDEETVSIRIPANVRFLTIKNIVKIFPKNNSSLEGIYESNGIFCSQCEPEGFRRITWYPDRPDNLAIFTTRIVSYLKHKQLLSNGNLIKLKKNDSKFSSAIWKDPFPKPCYLFAIVSGNLDVSEDTFITKSNRKILLQVFTEIGNKNLTKYALKSLKSAMSWDEKFYNLEYDLDRYMIVAVDHFNMGAMENKGLNIFNSKYVLADPNTATDQDLFNIESIIAHEYFHNWTGNRVTCRDWFQLTLKEGLTVFRDQQFTESMRGFSKKRIEDVSFLKTVQFPEDIGPNRHPIRPESYIEINNFYTSTIYEKGAEVIRMLYNLLGKKKFKACIKYYLKKFDGRAATCEDFIFSLEKKSKKSLKIFLKWYKQFGLITLKVERNKSKNNELELLFSQICNEYKNPVPIPIKFSLIDRNGKMKKFKIKNSEYKYEQTFILKKKNDKIKILNVGNDIIPSLMRDFSAPVVLKHDLKTNELLKILNYDNNDFIKWDASQSLHTFFYNRKISNQFILILNNLIKNKNTDMTLLSKILKPPSFEIFDQMKSSNDPLITFNRRENYIKSLFQKLESSFEILLKSLISIDYENNNSYPARELISYILPNLFKINNDFAIKTSLMLLRSKLLTLKIIGLSSFISSGDVDSKKHLNNFYKNFSHSNLLVEKWFSMMSELNCKAYNSLEDIKSLLNHEKFSYKNPNKIRAILGTFQKKNIELFHASDGSGYNFIANEIIKIDKINPQISSRLVLPMTRFSHYTSKRRKLILKHLVLIKKNNPSKDLNEILIKSF